MKIVPNGLPCCFLPEEGPTSVDSYDTPTSCSTKGGGYICGKINWRILDDACSRNGEPYGCSEPYIAECGPNEHCIDEDQDNYYELDFECNEQGEIDCDDTNANIHPNATEICNDPGLNDEDCNGKRNCEEAQCRPDPDNNCLVFCDKDHDGYLSTQCDGNDCKDDPNLWGNAANVFPGQDVENTQELCSDGESNDCDSEVDCGDSDCSAFCMPGGGGEPTIYYECYGYYLVTTYYSCSSEGCTYLYESWEFLGVECSVY